jgi:hypothetical protein
VLGATVRLHKLETIVSCGPLVLNLVTEDVRVIAPAPAASGAAIREKPLCPKCRLTATVVVETEGLLQIGLLADRAGEKTKGTEVWIDVAGRRPTLRVGETYCCDDRLLIFVASSVDDFGYLAEVPFSHPFESGAQRFVFAALSVEVNGDLTRKAHPAIMGRSGTQNREDLLLPQLGRQSADVIHLRLGEGERFLDVAIDWQDPRQRARLNGDG